MKCPLCQRDTGLGDHGAGLCNKTLAEVYREAHEGPARRPVAAPVPEGQRRCSKCKTVKPADLEHFPRVRTNGLSSWCRECSRISARAYDATPRSKDPLKRLACAFGSAPKGSEREATARAELVAAVLAEAQGRSAA